MISPRNLLPSIVTAVALSCGLAALEATRLGAWDWTLRLILLAAIADGMDGALARQLHSTSPLGGQLDSLADIVAFGAAPAFLLETYFSAAPTLIRFGAALAFLLAGAYRLARFHAQPREGVFQGLPITAAGVLLTLAVAGPFGTDSLAATLIASALAALMVCRHPFQKVRWSRRLLVAYVLLVAPPLIVRPGSETLAVLGAMSIGAYLAWTLVRKPVLGILVKVQATVHVAGGPVRGAGGRGR